MPMFNINGFHCISSILIYVGCQLPLMQTVMLQVNFFKDHTKLVVNVEHQQRPLLLYVDEERCATAFSLGDIARYGCDDSLRGRLQFALSALGEFVEVELRDGP